MFNFRIRIVLFVFLIFPVTIFAAQDILVPNKVQNALMVSYLPFEKKMIRMDFENISDLVLTQAKRGQKHKIYVGTAGAPGASKTTILETYLHDHHGFVYVDPDQRALKFMINTYVNDLNNYGASKATSYRSFLKNGYVKWRAASNYIANKILNEAFAEDYAIAHGTTATGIHMDTFYQKLHDNDYKIVLLLCASPLNNRRNAVNYRETKQCLVQSTRTDFVRKGQRFYESFPIYFKYADEIQMYWTADYRKGSIKVGEYTPTKGFKKTDPAFNRFLGMYDYFRKTHPAEKLPKLGVLLKPKVEAEEAAKDDAKVKVEPKSNAKSKPKAKVKAKIKKKVLAKSSVKKIVKVEGKIKSKTKAKTKAKVKSKVQAKSKSKSKAKVKSKVQAKSKAKVKSKTK